MQNEFNNMTQTDFWDYVYSWDIAIEGDFDHKKYFWSYKDKLTLKNIKINGFANKLDWINWINNEQSIFIADMGYDRYGEIETEWIPNPTIEPVIMVKLKNGYYDIVYGWHRTALAFKNNLNNIPVVLGIEE